MTEVLAVRGRRATEKFLKMPFPLYRGDPLWIPPLNHSARRFMSPRHNPYFKTAEIEHFVAVDDTGAAIGRISTTLDPDYVARFGKTGFFGWFETVDDPAVAGLLLSRAEDWARDRGMQRLAGPYSYCATQEFGLLVEGFDTIPAIFQPHNPAYYQDLLATHGYEIDFRTDTYRWTAERDGPLMRAAVRRAEQACQRYGLTVRRLDPRRRAADFDVVFDLFQASFAHNHDVVPMNRELFDHQESELRQFLDPRLISIVESGGEPVGFSLLLADANQVLHAAHGSLSPGLLLRMLKLTRQISGAVVLMIGVRPDFSGRGVGRVLAGEIAKVGLGLAGPYDTVDTTWIHEHNWESRALVRRTGATPYRRYAVFGKAL